jgi:MoxR-like ATPase
MAKSTCTACGQHIEFPDEMAGREVTCPNCRAKITLDQPGGISIRVPKSATRGPAEREAGKSPVAPLAERIIANIEKVVIGKRLEILLTLMAYLAEGHVLLEDVPGVAKTMLARALAGSVGCSFKRIQCTPDLLPNDITGSSIFNPKTTEFEFRPGPLFAQLVLADEINRATPRAQAALLEAMAERKVTADGTNYDLTPPFFLIATQNPIDHEGTFPLPEAQLDRFLTRLSLGYPQMELEIAMLQRLQLRHPIDTIQAVATAEEVIAAQRAVREVHVDEKVCRYIVQIIQATREHYDIALGGSPRASMALFHCAQSFAAIHSFDFVMPDDVKQIALPVLGHRLILRPESRLRKKTVPGIVAEILNSVPVPQVHPGAAAR